jgi:hypothetical protein
MENGAEVVIFGKPEDRSRPRFSFTPIWIHIKPSTPGRSGMQAQCIFFHSQSAPDHWKHPASSLQ